MGGVAFVISVALDYTNDPAAVAAKVPDVELAKLSKPSRKFATAYNYLRESYGGFLFGVFSILMTIYLVYKNGNNNYSYWCTWTGILEVLTFRACFLVLFVFMVYSWLGLYVTAFIPTAKPTKEKTA